MEYKNPTIITGHYGSGKTEFAVNYADMLTEQGEKIVIADMDIVNAYFRARRLTDYFKEKDVKLVSSNFAEEYYNDTPALSAALYECFENREQKSIIDVGGDPEGALVLARFADLLNEGEYNMWLAVNLNRPCTSTVEKNIDYLNMIENASKLKINGLINSTHMLRETRVEDILKGDEAVRSISEHTGCKVVYTAVPEFIIRELKDISLAGDLLPVKMLLRPDWI